MISDTLFEAIERIEEDRKKPMYQEADVEAKAVINVVLKDMRTALKLLDTLLTKN